MMANFELKNAIMLLILQTDHFLINYSWESNNLSFSVKQGKIDMLGNFRL